jgi:hypothetical protein
MSEVLEPLYTNYYSEVGAVVIILNTLIDLLSEGRPIVSGGRVGSHSAGAVGGWSG